MSDRVLNERLGTTVRNGIRLHSAALETPKCCNKRCVKVA